MRKFFVTLWAAIVQYCRSVDPGVARAIIFKIVRYLVTGAGLLLEAKGYLDKSQAEQLIAAIPTISGFAFEVYDVYVVRAKINNALIAGRAETGTQKDKTVAVTALKETATK